MSEPATTPIGLYGGSFNPPHLAHVLVVAWALASAEVGQVWVIPTGGHPFGKPLAPFADRLELCRRAFALFGERVSVLEIEREPVVHYTIETVRHLAERHPGQRWRWIMGSDTLDDAAQWREFDALERLAPPLLIPRQGHGPARGSEPGQPGFALPDISSTLIREELRAGHLGRLRGLVPGAVLTYLEEHPLYTTADGGASEAPVAQPARKPHQGEHD